MREEKENKKGRDAKVYTKYISVALIKTEEREREEENLKERICEVSCVAVAEYRFLSLLP